MKKHAAPVFIAILFAVGNAIAGEENVADPEKPVFLLDFETDTPAGLITSSAGRESKYVVFNGYGEAIVLGGLPASLTDALSSAFTVEIDVCFGYPASARPTALELLDVEGKPVFAIRSSEPFAPHPTGRPDVLFRPVDGKSQRLLSGWEQSAAIRMCENIVPGLWVRLAVTVNPGVDVAIYSDGVCVGRQKLDSPLSAITSLRLGGVGSEGRFCGKLDNLAVWKGIRYDENTSRTAAIAGRASIRQESFLEWNKLMLPENSAWQEHHPRMLIGKGRLEQIRERLKFGRGPELLRRFLAECDDWIDPESKNYYNPKEYTLEMDRYEVLIPSLLCLASQLTGDGKYAVRAGKIVRAYAEYLGYHNVAHFMGKIAYSGGTVRMMALAYDWGYEWFTPEERAAVREGLMELAAGIFAQLENRQTRMMWICNWNSMGIASMGHAALAIAGEVSAPVQLWKDRAERLAGEYLNFAAGRDGGFHEGGAYFFYGVQHIVVFAESLRTATGRDIFSGSSMTKTMDYMNYLTMPWGREMMPVKYGSPGGGNPANRHVIAIYRDRVGGDSVEFLWQNLYNDDKYPPWCQLFSLLWFKPDQPPVSDPGLPLGKWLRDIGTVAFRTGWQKDDLAGVFFAHNPKLMAHDQLDRGQYLLYGYGGRWAIDNGGRQLRNSAHRDAHNLVTVDGVTEMQQTGNNFHVDSYLRNFAHADSAATVASADLTASYQYSYDWDMGIVDSKREKRAKDRFDSAWRHLAFMREENTPPYLLVYDELKKDNDEHEYIWNFHTDGRNAVNIEGNQVCLRQSAEEGLMFVHRPLQPGELPGPAGVKNAGGMAEYEISVPTDGNYSLWGYGRAGDVMPGGMDSFFVSFCEDKNISWSAGYEYIYKWLQVGTTLYKLKAGETYVLKLSMREPEARVSRFALVPEGKSVLEINTADRSGVVFINAAEPARISQPFAVAREEKVGCREAGMDLTLLTPITKISAESFKPDMADIHARLQAVTRRVEGRFLAFMYPHEPGMETPELAPVEKAEDAAWTIKWRHCEDLVFINRGAGISALGAESDASLLVLRVKGRHLVSFMLQNGSFLKFGNTYFKLTDGKGAALYARRELTIGGQNVTGFSLIGLPLSGLKAYGKTVNIVKEGEGWAAGKVLVPDPVITW
jgi:hypothetical protein